MVWVRTREEAIEHYHTQSRSVIATETESEMVGGGKAEKNIDHGGSQSQFSSSYESQLPWTYNAATTFVDAISLRA